MEGEACKRNHGGGILKEEAAGSIRGYLGSIWKASRGIWTQLKTSGDIQGPCDPESGDIKGPSEKGGSFTIVKMGSKRRERPFYRRVAKVGGTKYRKTHGSRDGRKQQQQQRTPVGRPAFRARVATILDKKRYPSAAE